MPAQIIIFLSVGERGREHTALRCSQMPIMKEAFLSIGSRLPAHHASGSHSDPINSASFVCKVSVYIVEAFAAEQLALPRNVQLSLQAVGLRVVATFLLKNCPGHSELGILFEL